jgi:hypothetical protein
VRHDVVGVAGGGVAELARRVDDLAEQQRPAVAEAGLVHAELVAGVGLRCRPRAVRQPGTHQESDARRPAQRGGVGTDGGQRQLDEHVPAGLPRQGRLRRR